MRLLLVGMTGSIHLARAAGHAVAGGWEVAVFPSYDAPVHPAFSDVTIFQPTLDGRAEPRPGVDVVAVPSRGWPVPAERARVHSLASAIRRFAPDVVHAHEVKFGGYPAAAAMSRLRRRPPLILTAWGSDLHLRARLPAERPRIVETLRRVDVLTAECDRDLRHARQLGFRGETVSPMPVAGGYDVARLAALRAPGPTSRRRVVALKGYQHFAGRAQIALRAIELCGDRLSGLTLAVYSAQPAEVLLARRAARRAGMDLEVVGTVRERAEHEQILRLHGRARVSLGLSISDGVSQSFLEALIMGSLPVQSSTACVDEWISDGETGLIVPPEDPHAVAAALKRAVEDDALVDRAATTNRATALARLDTQTLRGRLLALYERAADGAIIRAR